MNNAYQIPGLAGFFEHQPQPPPVHSFILRIDSREMVLHYYRVPVKIEAVVDRVPLPQDLVVADLLGIYKVRVIDEPGKIVTEAELNRISRAVVVSPYVFFWSDAMFLISSAENTMSFSASP